MTRIDAIVVGTLVVLFALIAGLVGVPSLVPTASTALTPTRRADLVRGPALPRGCPRPSRLGQPVVGTDAGRPRSRLARLLGPGPQRAFGVTGAGPCRALDGRPDRCCLDLRAAARRPLARWRAGDRRRRRVHDPRPAGSRVHRSGGGVVERGRRPDPGPGDRGLHARHAARGVPPGRDPADRPGPPAVQHPGRRAGRPPVRTSADRIRAVRRGQSERRLGGAHPSRQPDPAAGHCGRERPRRPTRWRRRRRSIARTARSRTCRGSSSRSSTRRRPWRLPIERGRSTPRPASRPSWGATSPLRTGSRALRYPGSTLTTVLLNLRPGHPEFADPKVRTALLAALDRPRLITDAFAMAAAPAIGLDPARVVPVRPGAGAAGAVRPVGRARGPDEGRLDPGVRRLASPEVAHARVDRAAQPGRSVQSRCVRFGCRRGT